MPPASPAAPVRAPLSCSAGRFARPARAEGAAILASMPRIYTKTGDDGTTGLLYGGRVSKADLVPEACGTLDEAVAVLGLARAHAADPALSDELLGLQRELFVVGADLATNPDQRARLEPGVSLVSPEMVARLESRIDELVAGPPAAERVHRPRREPRLGLPGPRAQHDPSGRAARGRAPRVRCRRERGRVPLPEPAVGHAVRPGARRGRRDGADQPDRGIPARRSARTRRSRRRRTAGRATRCRPR